MALSTSVARSHLPTKSTTESLDTEREIIRMTSRYPSRSVVVNHVANVRSTFDIVTVTRLKRPSTKRETSCRLIACRSYFHPYQSVSVVAKRLTALPGVSCVSVGA